MENPFLNKLQIDNEHVISETSSLFSKLSETQMRWKPTEKAWSVLECFNHLYITGNLYYPAVEALLERTIKEGVKSNEPFRPTWFGKWFIGLVLPESKRKIKTVSIFTPTEDLLTPLSCKDQFIQLQQKYIKLIQRSDGYNLRWQKLSSPANRLLRFTLGEALWLTVAHNQRHLLQTQKLTNLPLFPSA